MKVGASGALFLKAVMNLRVPLNVKNFVTD
jgi:hypothetical protein